MAIAGSSRLRSPWLRVGVSASPDTAAAAAPSGRRGGHGARPAPHAGGRGGSGGLEAARWVPARIGGEFGLVCDAVQRVVERAGGEQQSGGAGEQSAEAAVGRGDGDAG